MKRDPRSKKSDTCDMYLPTYLPTLAQRSEYLSISFRRVLSMSGYTGLLAYVSIVGTLDIGTYFVFALCLCLARDCLHSFKFG